MKNPYVYMLGLGIFLTFFSCQKEEEIVPLAPLEDIRIELPEPAFQINDGEISFLFGSTFIQLRDISVYSRYDRICFDLGLGVQIKCPYRWVKVIGYTDNQEEKVVIKFKENYTAPITECIPTGPYKNSEGRRFRLTYTKTGVSPPEVYDLISGQGNVILCDNGKENRDLRDPNDIIRPEDSHFTATFSGILRNRNTGEEVTLRYGRIEDISFD